MDEIKQQLKEYFDQIAPPSEFAEQLKSISPKVSSPRLRKPWVYSVAAMIAVCISLGAIWQIQTISDRSESGKRQGIDAVAENANGIKTKDSNDQAIQYNQPEKKNEGIQKKISNSNEKKTEKDTDVIAKDKIVSSSPMESCGESKPQNKPTPQPEPSPNSGSDSDKYDRDPIIESIPDANPNLPSELEHVPIYSPDDSPENPGSSIDPIDPPGIPEVPPQATDGEVSESLPVLFAAYSSNGIVSITNSQTGESTSVTVSEEAEGYAGTFQMFGYSVSVFLYHNTDGTIGAEAHIS